MIYRYELKKLAGSSVLIAFIVLCIGLNALISLSSYRNPYNEPPANASPVNIFESYHTEELAEGYILKYRITGIGAELLREKYGKLQLVVDEKSANGDALSVYLGENTPYLHSLLFKTLFQAITAEICLLSLLGALLSTTYEQTRKTDSLVYASKTGRSVQIAKMYAALTASAVAGLIIFGASLLLFFVRFDFSEAWSANVSSSFNRAVDELKPFMTWHSFTVAEYFAATIVLSFGLAFCFCLLGFALGIGFRQAYAAFVAAVSTIACLFLFAFIFPVGSLLRGIWTLNPVWLWKNAGAWFTDGGANILWLHFEWISLGFSFPILALSAGGSFILLKRRELR